MELAHRLKASAPLPGLAGLTVADFWSWAYSDILENIHRGYYAEFLVGAALGLLHLPRVGWKGYDFLYNNYRLEVKSSAYIQSWHKVGSKETSPSFSISERVQWDPDGGPVPSTPVRACDCYVFCLFSSRDRQNANVLDASAWEFYVVSTADVISHFAKRRQLPLSLLQAVVAPVMYESLRSAIDRAFDQRAKT